MRASAGARLVRCELVRSCFLLALGLSLGCADQAPDRTGLVPPGEPGSTSADTTASAPDSAAPATPIVASTDTWTVGIVAKAQQVTGAALLIDARAAPNAGFDRLVLEFDGDVLPSYHVEYIDRPVRQCGSGDVVPFEGDAWLAVRLQPADAHTEQGVPTVKERSVSPGLPVVRQMTLTCDFEAQVEWVLGVSSPNQYRVMELRDPARLVVDVRH